MTRNQYLRKYVYDYNWTIVPVLAGTKRPAVNWKEYQERKPTQEELKQWFHDPNVGVGLITGKASGVTVIDEDSYKASGAVLRLETPLVVTTGGGGRHYYYRYQQGMGNHVNHENAIDVRGEGGFVVLPPTLHPSGKAYEWLHELPEKLDGLPTLDESFAQTILKQQKSGQRILVPEFMNLGEGGRNDGLHRLACSLVNKHSEEDALMLLQGVNSTYTPPLPDNELLTIWKSAVQFVRSHPKIDPNKPISEQMKILTFSEADQKYQELTKKYGDGITTGYALLDEYFKFLPQQLYMMSATTHAGKTTIALNMAGRIARKGFKVIFASLEQGVFVIPRIKSILGSEQGTENLYFIAPDDLPKVDDLLDLINNEPDKPALLIIDHLHYFERGNKNAAEEMDRLVLNMQRLAKKLEIPVVVIAHVRKLNLSRTKKGQDTPPVMEDLKDSNSLSQVPAVVVMLHRKLTDSAAVGQGGNIMSDEGVLYIYKNRIHGRTGSEPFKIFKSGEIVFDRQSWDQLSKGQQSISLPTPVPPPAETDILSML